MNIKKTLPFTSYSYPSEREDGLSDCGRMIKDAKGIGEFLSELRDRTFKIHNAFTTGEVAGDTIEKTEEFIGDNGYFSTMFDFRETEFGRSKNGWYDNRRITPEEFKECCFKTQKNVGTNVLLCTEIENHDQPRGVSYYIPESDLNDTSKKFIAAMQFMMRGIPFIYQGQELGMENTVIDSLDGVDDISTHEEYKVALKAGLSPKEALKAVTFYSRDNARTPFQWNGSENAGFTAGIPWLKVNPNYKEINAEKEIGDRNSVLAFYKELIALRKSKEYGDVLVYGKVIPYLEKEPRLMAFYRKGEESTLLVLGNFQNGERITELPSPCRKVILNNCDKAVFTDEAHIKLLGYQAIVMEL